MDQDDKAARDIRRAQNGGRVVPIVRTTAPAGTPARRSPEGPLAGPEAIPVPAASPSGPRMPSERPLDTLTPPRTVGGHTARLKVEHEVDLDFGPKVAPPRHAEPFEPVPSSRAIGGTMRLVVDEPTKDEGGKPAPVPAAGRGPDGDAGAKPAAPAAKLAAEEIAARQQDAAVEQMRAHQRAAARDATAEHQAKVHAAHEAAVKDAEAKLAAAKEAQKQAEKARREEEPSFFALLFAPMSVSVGLPFFAMGVMIALALDGRFSGGVRPSTTTAATTAPTLAPTAAPPPPTHLTAIPASTQVPAATAQAPLTVTPPRPTAVPGPGTKPHGGGGTKSGSGNPPPLPF